MSNMPTKEAVTNAIRECGQGLGRTPSKSEFKAQSGMSEYQILQHFPSWNEAVKAAGLEPDSSNVRLSDDVLLADWGELVRQLRHIPTRTQYRREGRYAVNSFAKHFGPWSAIPNSFRTFGTGKPEWADVLALLPVVKKPPLSTNSNISAAESNSRPTMPIPSSGSLYSKLDNRPTYGNPIDFRGLRHQPVNESGVVLLFGMVARELGYLVEAVQAGYPDCEAKRQVAPGKWQRVRIEFEFESRNFRDHGHPPDGCDVIVCWRHNWAECPENLEVVELSQIIQTLAATDE